MKNHKLIMLSIISAGAIIAAAIMQKFTPNQSWAAFAGWIIFFLAIQVPWIFVPQNKYGSCTTWFNSLKKKSIRG